jgi:type II secretory pathway component PulF
MGATVTCFLIVYMLWFVIPVGKTAYNTELSVINQTTPLMQTMLPITNNWWIIFPLLIVIAGGYTVFQYATNRDAFDY